MAEEGSEGSVANSSSTTNLWEIHGNSLSSLNNVFPWHHPPNPNSNSSCEEEISISNSFTNTSNHSGLSDGSSHQLFEPASRQIIEPMSSNEFSGEPVSANQIWHQVLLSSGELHNSQDAGENFLEALSSKNISTDMFEPACDYLKKIDNYWDFPNSESFSNIEKQLSRFNGSFLEHEKLSNLSNLGSNWSIAPPYPDVNSQIISPPPTRNISLNSMDQYSGSDLSQMKQNMPISSEFGTGYGNSGFLPCYGHDLKVEGQHQETEPFETFLHRSLKSNSLRYQMGNNNSVDGDNNSKYCYRMSDLPWSNPRNLSDITSFNDCLKPLVDLQASKPCLKALNSTDCKKQGRDTSLPVRGNGRGTGVTTEGKRKRCDDTSETLFKKPKRETSTVPSVKVSAPKAKLGERITALQQLVSPFGKTDTASVLQEAIGYIRFLQEQVQLLSNPYMKSNANKDPWGVLERKDKGEAKFDLKSRGLCLVPVSCTPQVCRDNTGSDYWTPTYRGCLYR